VTQSKVSPAPAVTGSGAGSVPSDSGNSPTISGGIGEAQVVAEWPKDKRGEVFRVSLTSYNGRPTVDVRVWWPSPDGNYRPGRQGMSCAVRHLPQLAEALAKALAVAIEGGLVDTTATVPGGEKAP
jgi:hypothetical protein